MAVRLKLTALAVAAAVLTLNVWTGAPLAAVWVGSRVQRSSSSPSMAAFVVVIAVLGVLVALLLVGLARVSRAWDEVAGKAPRTRRTSPWLRSMRAEREGAAEGRRELGAIERIVIAVVVLAVVCFEAWFFLFSGSSIGRG